MSAPVNDIMRLPDELRGAAWEESIKGQQIRSLRGLAATIINRENTPTAFISLDEERDEGDGHSLHERLATADPSELVDFMRARTAEFDEQTEAVLSLAREGAAALGRSLGLSGRRGQQIMQRQVKQTADATAFKQGKKGQGALFNFDGELA